MLEHVSKEYGLEYYNLLIRVGFTSLSILKFCVLNDKIGSPNKVVIPGLNTRVSATSLRYMYQAYLALTHAPVNADIVELGCGYGGLCLAVNYVSVLIDKPVASYSCIDLDNAIALQQKYLALHTLSFPVSFHPAMQYGADLVGNNYFFISNYCFSEITGEHRSRYITTLFPKITSGIIHWNIIPVYNFGKVLRIDEEHPKTGSLNKVVYF